MDRWRSTYLGLRELPRELTAFELQTFFTLSVGEREAIAQRRSVTHQLGLALHIGFMRMSGRLLDAFRVVPANLWSHLGERLDVTAPQVASLRAMYKRGRTLYDHHQVACEVLGFAWTDDGRSVVVQRKPVLPDDPHMGGGRNREVNRPGHSQKRGRRDLESPSRALAQRVAYPISLGGTTSVEPTSRIFRAETHTISEDLLLLHGSRQRGKRAEWPGHRFLHRIGGIPPDTSRRGIESIGAPPLRAP